MILPALSFSETESFYEGWRRGGDYSPSSFEVGFGSKSEGDELIGRVQAVISQLEDSFLSKSGAEAKSEFDAEASCELHACMPLPGYAIANDDFWRYLTVVEMWNLVVWRHGSDDDDERTLGKGNVGLGDRWDIMPKRLWLRGDIGVTDSEDAYELVRRGGMDFWTSGLVRRRYAGSRPLARALIRFQYPEEGSFKGPQYRPQTLGLDAIRTLYKRLRHFQTFIALSTLDDDAAAKLVEGLSKDLLPGKAS